MGTTPARVFQAGDVANNEEASSEITLAKNSLAENDEKHRRAYGRACIALRKGFWQDLKAWKKQAAESSQKHDREERFRRQRPYPAVRRDTGLPLR